MAFRYKSPTSIWTFDSAMNSRTIFIKPSTRLEQFIALHLPLVKAMSASINFYDGKDFRLQAPLQLNHNDKGTAFGGSLYNLCITNAIGLGFLKSYEKGLAPNLVVAKAEIEYLRPATDQTLIAHCKSPSEKQWAEFFDKFQHRGKAKIDLESTVYQDGKIACLFKGQFAIIGACDL